MKRPLIIGAILVLSTLLIYACSSTIRTASTSFVTITIGEGQGAGTLHAEKATFWARVKNLAADINLLPKAYAYIPSAVKVLVVTISAPDMTTIVAVDNVANKSSASILIEVPNGSARQFQVEGLDASSAVAYRGTALADLTGADVTLPIEMLYAGAGIYVNASTGSDLATCGTSTAPCLTIAYALTLNPLGNETIVVEQGNHVINGSLQLNPGTKLTCAGSNRSSVIDGTATTVAIYGNTGASVENCRIIPGCDATAIDDRIGGSVPAPMTINHVLIDQDPGGGFPCPPWEAVILSADSVMMDSAFVDTYSSFVTVNSGSPTIKNSTLPGTSNSAYGIYVQAGSPLIDGNVISGAADGIYVAAGTPTVTRNSIHDNYGAGITVNSSTANPVINYNSIYCNYNLNLSTLATTTIDARYNAWENAPPAVADATVGCLQGTDICYSGPMPDYLPADPAVPGVCVRPVAKPLTR